MNSDSFPLSKVNLIHQITPSPPIFGIEVKLKLLIF